MRKTEDQASLSDQPDEPDLPLFRRQSVLIVVGCIALALWLFWTERLHRLEHPAAESRTAILAAGLADMAGIQPDYRQAMRDFQKAAVAGSGRAMNDIGILYAEGKGVQRSYATAMIWYRKAAKLGVADGMNNIGVLYANGHGVPTDYTAAMRWFKQAVTKGSAKAMIGIAMLYRQGRGVPQNAAKATEWYKRAAASSDPVARTIAKAALANIQ